MPNPAVHRLHERPDRALTAELARQGVATLHEAMGRRGLLDPLIRPVASGWTVAGPAVTSLNHPGDNLMVHAALSVCEPGDILVVSTTVPCMCGMIGELLARQAKVRQLSGIVIDSGVRDVADLRQLGLPIWSASITAAGSVKATPGWVNIPMVCGGVLINPGDIVVADDDGIVSIPQSEAAQVLNGAKERTEREVEVRTRIEGGELSFDMNDLRGYLEHKGVTVA